MSNKKKNRINMVEVKTEGVTNVEVTDAEEESVTTAMVKPRNKFIAACDKWGKAIKKGTSEIWEATPKPVKFVLGGIIVAGVGLIAKGYVSSLTEEQGLECDGYTEYETTDDNAFNSNDTASEENTCESMIDTDVVENVN